MRPPYLPVMAPAIIPLVVLADGRTENVLLVVVVVVVLVDASSLFPPIAF